MGWHCGMSFSIYLMIFMYFYDYDMQENRSWFLNWTNFNLFQVDYFGSANARWLTNWCYLSQNWWEHETCSMLAGDSLQNSNINKGREKKYIMKSGIWLYLEKADFESPLRILVFAVSYLMKMCSKVQASNTCKNWANSKIFWAFKTLWRHAELSRTTFKCPLSAYMEDFGRQSWKSW